MKPRRSVLIVEDEPIIAMMVEEFLDALGHDVAGIIDNVPDALAQVAAGGFDLVILDMTLRDGLACWPVADALAARDIPYIIASGGMADQPPQIPGRAAILDKPYVLSSIRAAIEKLPV